MKFISVVGLVLILGVNLIKANTCLSSHNALRKLHKDTPDLVWDEDLAVKAKAWAEHLVTLGYMEHSYVSGEGENIYYAKSIAKAACVDASISWYKEIYNYDFSNAGTSSNGKMIGHFTQLVWKKSTHVGVGLAFSQPDPTNSMITTFIVAKYKPQGNFYYEGKKTEAYNNNVKGLISTPLSIPSRYTLDPTLCNKDNSQWCSYFKQNKYCETSKDAMHSYCPKTCFC